MLAYYGSFGPDDVPGDDPGELLPDVVADRAVGIRTGASPEDLLARMGLTEFRPGSARRSRRPSRAATASS